MQGVLLHQKPGGLLGRLSKKWLCHFFEKASLRSAPQLSADSGQFDAHSAQSVFRHAHVAAENELYCFRVCGRETLRGFFRQAELPLQVGHEMAMGALRTFDPLMNGGNVPLLFSADRITRLHRTLASLAKGGGSAQAESEGFFSRKNTTPPVCCAYGRRQYVHYIFSRPWSICPRR